MYPETPRPSDTRAPLDEVKPLCPDAIRQDQVEAALIKAIWEAADPPKRSAPPAPPPAPPES